MGNHAHAGLQARASRVLRATDRAQQGRPWLAVPVATWKKFSDDQAGNLAALVAYYAFVSVFPLLLVAYTILDLLSRGSASLAHRLTTALRQYPVIGTHLGGSVRHGLGATGLALAVGTVVALFGARGIASAIQNAMNAVWGVPRFQRPGFGKGLLRSLGLIAVVGPGEVLTIALSTVAGGVAHLGGAGGRVAAVAVSLVLNVGLFWLGFRLATAGRVASRDLRLGAILAAVAWQALQFGGGLVIAKASNTAYGTFGIVIGLLAWFYLQAQITLYAAELDVVRARRLWPRALMPPPHTDADLRAGQLRAQATQLQPDLEITVDPQPPRPPAD